MFFLEYKNIVFIILVCFWTVGGLVRISFFEIEIKIIFNDSYICMGGKI